MSELMGRNEYARHRGCSQNAVSKAVRDGRIVKAAVLDDGGKLIGIKWRLADELWALNTDPEAAAKSGKGELAMERQASAEAEADEPAEPRDPTYRDSINRIKWAEAQLKEMQALERAGALVSAAGVRKEFMEIARATRNAMLAVYDRVAPALSPSAQKMLDNAIRQALGELTARLEQRTAADTGVTEPEAALQ